MNRNALQCHLGLFVYLLYVTSETNCVCYLSIQPLFEFVEWDAGLPPLAQPNLDFLAPEYALTMTCSLASDMFSFGILLYSLFNEGRPLYECHGQLSTFRKNAAEVRIL